MARIPRQSEIPPFGATGLSATPLEAIGRSFRDAIAWIQRGPQDDFTFEELVQVGSAAECVRAGDLEKALVQLRQVNCDQIKRRKRGIFRKVVAILRWRTHPTVVAGLLSQLLAARAVERVNGQIEKINRAGSTEEIITRLKRMAREGGGVLGVRAGPLSLSGDPSDRLAELLAKYGGACGDEIYSQIGTCAVCAKPAIGEMRQADGTSWKLCNSCIKNAQSIQKEQQGQRQALRKAIDQSVRDLEEAIGLDPKNDHARENLRAGQGLLREIQ